MDIAVERNAYGRQIDSRVARDRARAGVRAAHRAGQTGGGVHSRAHHPPRRRPTRRCWRRYNGDPVLVEQGRHLVATFHPELTRDPRVHELFLEKL